MVTVRGRLGGERVTFELPVDLREAVAHEGLSTLWARRQIAAWDWNLDVPAAVRDEEVETLALRHHLVSRRTSLVAVDDGVGGCGGGVGVDVPQLLPAGEQGQLVGGIGGLLGTGGGGVGVGGLGTRGVGIGGGGGYAAGSGYGLGGGRFGGAAAGSVVQNPPVVAGSLDSGMIRKVVTRHMNAVRYCYQRELGASPSMSGRLVVAFTVGADGSVIDVEAREDSLGSPSVSSCVLGRFRRMVFPPVPGGGVVVVKYPLEFSPGP